ncbi:MAG: TerC family protein [Schleiferilactobacillus harbinensis]|jgi:YkoY family integral membrane protein|uniref:TerC family membrane protein n=1 Tax=Schleiferilactobacillus perolens DSM 12744 TaxID=1423792 RepID=A0A0R1MZE5_9LACO|nr:TerC family protein [Schleiferilactobacillus perolens]KRL09619.1 TerC family membrane protein [Schleiferilactobacillus perolens DSM 12744]MCI1890982.1 TerC family protein [Schleiferilactobacillus harbinensis]MCI1913306.1 TerC family protein [Schleiferilactobacillus harbinensis]
MYGPFFDLNNWAHVITSGNDWLIILSLILLECLLSVDNAVVLAAQTQALPTEELQRKSLLYGIWGAYLFRFIAIGLGTYLIHFWFIKILGAGYLAYLSFHFFWDRYHHIDDAESSGESKLLKGKHHRISLFWRVVISIESMDIVFSIDSILASVAVSKNPVVVLIGGMIGILCMRGVAEIIMALMAKIPELEVMAYALIAIIAVKLFLAIPMIGIEIPNKAFALIVAGAIAVTLIIHFVRQAHTATSKQEKN